MDGQVIGSDSEEEDEELGAVPSDVAEKERELVIIRKVIKKWWRLAGIK